MLQVSDIKSIIPLNDKIVVRKDEDPEKLGILVLPHNTRKREVMQIGTVKAIGPGRFNEHGRILPMACTPGDRVCLLRYGGFTVKIEGVDYTVIDDPSIYTALEYVPVEDSCNT